MISPVSAMVTRGILDLIEPAFMWDLRVACELAELLAGCALSYRRLNRRSRWYCSTALADSTVH